MALTDEQRTEVLHALSMRLDTRCIKWPMRWATHEEPLRCGTCYGCTATRIEGMVRRWQVVERTVENAEVLLGSTSPEPLRQAALKAAFFDDLARVVNMDVQ